MCRSTSEQHVRKVKEIIKQRLGNPPWFLAIGIRLEELTNQYHITVRLRPDHPDVSEILPARLEGVAVRIVHGLTGDRES